MPDVAFCRTLKPGMRGDDVVAHKRALSRNMPKTYPWTQFTDFFGAAFQTAVKAFQHAHAIPQTGVIGSTTHTALEKAHIHGGTDTAFDAYAAKLAADFCREYGKTPEQRTREAIVAAALFWYSQRSAIAYSQYRPMWLGHPPSVAPRWDCSGFVTACHYAGGASDPNGRGFDGQGYTGTLMDHGQRVAGFDDLQNGDLVFYGFSSGRPGFNAGDPTHVAIKVDAAHVVSMGHYPMAYYPWHYRSDVNHFRAYPITGGAL